MRNVTVRGGYTDYQAACVLGYDTAVHKIFLVSNCIVEGGSALYQSWMLAATDILGHARIFKHAKVPGQPRTVDIGAFECQWKPGSLLLFR